jgi:hypothetical protein
MIILSTSHLDHISCPWAWFDPKNPFAIERRTSTVKAFEIHPLILVLHEFSLSIFLLPFS